MRFPRITIFVLIASFLLEPLTPAMVQAASEKVGNKWAEQSDLGSTPLPPFPEDEKQMPIDWSEIDWDKEAILPKDHEEFNVKLRELEGRGQLAEASQLKLKKRLWSDDEVMAHYQVPEKVRELVAGYRLNIKNIASPQHRAALKSFLSERVKTILLIQNYYPPDFDNKNQEQPSEQKIDIKKTAPIKVRRDRAVKPASAENVRAVLQQADRVNSDGQDVFRRPGKPIPKAKPKKVSFGAWARSL